MYAVKEIFYSIQGEGIHVGRPAVFCRFSGCNLWTGRERDRLRSVCTFCDTDFVGTNGPSGGFYGLLELAERIDSFWPDDPAYKARKFVVFTGGEPLLQLDAPLVRSLKERGFYLSVETNGTQDLINGVDWVCMSPKVPAPQLRLRKGDELKFVYPQSLLKPEDFSHLSFEHFTVQPMDGPDIQKNMQLALAFCQKDPRWRLSLQIHKILGCP